MTIKNIAVAALCILHVATSAQNLYSAKDNALCLYGYKDRADHWAIKPAFVTAEAFYQGYAVVMYGGKYGVIDATGKFVLTAKYDKLRHGQANQFWYELDGQDGVIRTDGTDVLAPSAWKSYPEWYGYIIYDEQRKLWGYCDSAGAIVQPRITKDFVTREGLPALYAFTTDSTVGYINGRGKIIYEGPPGSLGGIDENHWFITRNSSKYYIHHIGGGLLYAEGLDSVKWIYNYPIFNVCENGKWKLINYNGKVLTFTTYDALGEFYPDGVATFKVDGHYGILDTAGKVKVAPRYDEIWKQWPWLIYRKGSLYGVLDYKGKRIDTVEYENGIEIIDSVLLAVKNNHLVCKRIPSLEEWSWQLAIPRSDDWFSANKRFKMMSNYGVVDNYGKVVVEPNYSYIKTWGHNYVAYNNGLCGLITENGEEITGIIFLDLNFMVQNEHTGYLNLKNYAFVHTTGGHTGVIDEKGHWLIDTAYKLLSYFDADGRVIWVSKDDSTWSLANAQGKIISPAKYYFNGAFTNGHSAVVADSLTGVIDTGGHVILPCAYNNIVSDNYGFYWCQTNGLWGLADWQGHTLIDTVLQNFLPFTTGCAFAKKNGLWGVVDSSAKYTPGFSVLTAQGYGKANDTYTIAHPGNVNFQYTVRDGSWRGDNVNVWLLVDTSTNPRYRDLINNELLNEVRPFYYNLWWANRSGAAFMFDRKIDNKQEGWEEINGATNLQVANLSKTTCTIIQQSWSYHRYDDTTTTRTNYLFASNALRPITLVQLFIGPQYQPLLSKLCMAKIKTMPEVEIDCSNPDNLAPAYNFEISPNGLVFYFDNRAQNMFNSKTFPGKTIPVTIPYKDIESVVDKHGPLSRFY